MIMISLMDESPSKNARLGGDLIKSRLQNKSFYFHPCKILFENSSP